MCVNTSRDATYLSQLSHDDVMETLSVLLALCERNPPVTGGFPSQMASNATSDVFFGVGPNERLINRRVGDLRRYDAHYDVIVM